jgi:hypothetical protein
MPLEATPIKYVHGLHETILFIFRFDDDNQLLTQNLTLGINLKYLHGKHV